MITLILTLLVLVALVVTAYFNLVIIRIEGESMLPSYRSGDYAFALRRKNYPYKKGDVILLYSPNGTPIIKRVDTAEVHNGRRFYYVLGDNASVSRDSRHYGHVEEGAIIGPVFPNRTNQ